MLSRFAKVLLVLTSFAPVLLTYSFVSWRQGQLFPTGLVLLSVALGLALLCFLFLRAAATQLPVIPCQVESVKTADNEILGFVLSYLLPLANLTQDSIDPLVLAFVLAFFLFIVWTTHSYHFNPMLSVLGYHFYEIDDSSQVSYVLVTKRSLRRARHTANVVQLSEYILLDAEKPDASE